MMLDGRWRCGHAVSPVREGSRSRTRPAARARRAPLDFRPLWNTRRRRLTISYRRTRARGRGVGGAARGGGGADPPREPGGGGGGAPCGAGERFLQLGALVFGAGWGPASDARGVKTRRNPRGPVGRILQCRRPVCFGRV